MVGVQGYLGMGGGGLGVCGYGWWVKGWVGRMVGSMG